MTTITLPEDLTGLTFVRTLRSGTDTFTITGREDRSDIVVWFARHGESGETVRLLDAALRGRAFRPASVPTP